MHLPCALRRTVRKCANRAHRGEPPHPRRLQRGETHVARQALAGNLTSLKTVARRLASTPSGAAPVAVWALRMGTSVHCMRPFATQGHSPSQRPLVGGSETAGKRTTLHSCGATCAVLCNPSSVEKRTTFARPRSQESSRRWGTCRTRVSELRPGTLVAFRVRAHNAVGWGPYSKVTALAPRTARFSASGLSARPE